MYAGVVTPPLIIGQAVRLDTAGQTRLIAASLLIAGVATLLQTLGVKGFVGNRLPFVNAASSAGIAPMLAIAETNATGDQLPAIYGAVMVAGVFCLAVGPFFGRLLRFFPPLVTGVVITLIGVTLMPVPVAWAQGGDRTAADFGDMKYLALAAFTLLVILLIQRFGRGFVKQVALLLGLLVGTLAAIPFGMADFGALRSAPVAALPTPFAFGAPEFRPAAIISLCLVTLVLMTESSAGMLAIGEICDRGTDGRTITRGLRTDGIATLLGPVFGGFPTSAFAQNVGVVSLTRVRSRYVVAAAGGALLVLGIFPVLGAVVSTVPMPVLGGSHRTVRLDRGERHPYPLRGRTRRQLQHHPGRRGTRRGHHPARRARLLRRIPVLGADRTGLRHQRRSARRGPAQPVLPPSRHPWPPGRGTQILLGSCRARTAGKRRKHHGSIGSP